MQALHPDILEAAQIARQAGLDCKDIGEELMNRYHGTDPEVFEWIIEIAWATRYISTFHIIPPEKHPPAIRARYGRTNSRLIELAPALVKVTGTLTGTWFEAAVSSCFEVYWTLGLGGRGVEGHA